MKQGSSKNTETMRKTKQMQTILAQQYAAEFSLNMNNDLSGWRRWKSCRSNYSDIHWTNIVHWTKVYMSSSVSTKTFSLFAFVCVLVSTSFILFTIIFCWHWSHLFHNTRISRRNITSSNINSEFNSFGEKKREKVPKANMLNALQRETLQL